MIDSPQIVPTVSSVRDGSAGPKLLIIVPLLLVALLPALWVYRDATSRGSDHALAWGVVVWVFFVIGFSPGVVALILYLVARNDRPSEAV